MRWIHHLLVFALLASALPGVLPAVSGEACEVGTGPVKAGLCVGHDPGPTPDTGNGAVFELHPCLAVKDGDVECYVLQVDPLRDARLVCEQEGHHFRSAEADVETACALVTVAGRDAESTCSRARSGSSRAEADVSGVCVPLAEAESAESTCSESRSFYGDANSDVSGICVPLAAGSEAQSTCSDGWVLFGDANSDVRGICSPVAVATLGPAQSTCSKAEAYDGSAEADVAGLCTPVALSGGEAQSTCSKARYEQGGSSSAQVSGWCTPVAVAGTGPAESRCVAAHGGSEDVSGLCLAIAVAGTGDATASCPEDPSGDCDSVALSGTGDAEGSTSASGCSPDEIDGPDADGDGIPDECDPAQNEQDIDEDGHHAPEDNCPGHANSQQRDADGDGRGDACDVDEDGDAVPDVAEPLVCRNIENPNFEEDGRCEGDDYQPPASA